MRILSYLAIPIISGLIGWITNFIAVKMIFRPRREIRFLGLRFIGLLPKRKMELAEKIADIVEKELISHRDLRLIIQTEDFHNQAGKVIKKRIEEFIQNKISSNILLTMLVSQEITNRLTETLMDELQKEIPGAISSLFEQVESNFDFKKIIHEKVSNFDMMRIESIVDSIASRELKAIEYLGGVLGFIVGLIQLAVILIGDLHV